jgi:hypothetical protein
MNASAWCTRVRRSDQSRVETRGGDGGALIEDVRSADDALRDAAGHTPFLMGPETGAVTSD